MTEQLLIFAFGPVQSFIAEARRSQDLWAGSHILSELGRAALQSLIHTGAKPIYPEPNATAIPNKLVVLLPDLSARAHADAARSALELRWAEIAKLARQQAMAWPGLQPDRLWEEIWERQISDCWECHWAAVPMLSDNYAESFRNASALLESAKHARPFAQRVEDGRKDSLGGSRSALRLSNLDAQEYWRRVGLSAGGARLRPDGRERLDALGMVKRFGFIRNGSTRIPSVSSIAAASFVARAKSVPGSLRAYRQSLERVLSRDRVPLLEDPDWPYDGDLLYAETLTRRRLEDGYQADGSALTESVLRSLRDAQSTLVAAVDMKPDAYYAIIVLDGDSIGKRIDGCGSATEHSEFSACVNRFAAGVADIVQGNTGFGQLIYAGGDDVIAMAPLSTAVSVARNLAEAFARETNGTASAGLAITHHLSPLSSALREARSAENAAKAIEGKGAVAIHVLKRSGETLRVRSKWGDIEALERVVLAMKSGSVSSRIAYDTRLSARAFSKADASFVAEVRRICLRHKSADCNVGDIKSLSNIVSEWATHLDSPEALADWLLVARFLSGDQA